MLVHHILNVFVEVEVYQHNVIILRKNCVRLGGLLCAII